LKLVKYLMALFVVSMVLQPLDLPSCAMGADQETSHHAAVHDGADRDCCSPERSEPMNDCEEAATCAFLSLGFLVIPAAAGAWLPLPEHHYDLIDDPRFTGLPAPPLFRPPIA
jgi:hypothetical protein